MQRNILRKKSRVIKITVTLEIMRLLEIIVPIFNWFRGKKRMWVFSDSFQKN